MLLTVPLKGVVEAEAAGPPACVACRLACLTRAAVSTAAETELPAADPWWTGIQAGGPACVALRLACLTRAAVLTAAKTEPPAADPWGTGI